MGNRFHEQTGEEVLAGLKKHFAATSQKLQGHVGRDDLPAEFRRRIRNEAVADAKAADQEARIAFQAWATKTVTAANQELASEEIGSAAEETAKLRREQTIQRLIDTARRQDDRDGPKNPDGRLVHNSAARALASEAQRLYLETSNYDLALAYAEAAEALGVDASRIKDIIQTQIWTNQPSKAKALSDLALVERATAIFEAQASGALVGVLQAAAAESKDAGDYDGQFLKDAVGPSMRAKVAAIAVAAKTGTDYAAPDGTLASTPTLPPSGRRVIDPAGSGQMVDADGLA